MDSDGRSHILFAAHGYRQQPSVGTDQSFAFNHETITQNPKLSATRGLVAVAHLIYTQNPKPSATRAHTAFACLMYTQNLKPSVGPRGGVNGGGARSG